MRKVCMWTLCFALMFAIGCGPEPPGPAPSDGQESPSTETVQPTPDTPAPTQSALPTLEPTPEPKPLVVAIDPGHQARGNSEREPVGPGATETKAKVSSGTQGRFTGVPEYQVTLAVSLQLRDELVKRGYTVVLTRETNDVNISNSQRAAVANKAHADAFVRIHCDGSDNPSVNGAFTICPTPANPYPVRQLYTQCRSLADEVLNGLVAATVSQKRNVWETDTMSGLNWCEVPSIIVEMGYMTNKAEDYALVSPEYQAKLVQGMANGLDNYFALQGLR